MVSSVDVVLGLDTVQKSPSGVELEAVESPPCVEQMGFDNVREPVTLKVPTGPTPIPFLPRDPTKTAVPVQVVLAGFKAGNTVRVDWLINGVYVSEAGRQVLYAVPVFQAGESMTPDLIAAPNPGAYMSGADRVSIGGVSRLSAAMQSPFAAVTIDQAALDRLGVTEEKPLVCRLLVVNAGPQDLVVGMTEPYPVGGGSLTVQEIGCLPAGTPAELIFSPDIGEPLAALGVPAARAGTPLHSVSEDDDDES